MAITNYTWISSIYPDFQELMNTDIAGLTNRVFTEIPNGLSLSSTPFSVADGAYAVIWDGVKSLDFEVNSLMGCRHGVILELGFLLNPNDSGHTSYKNAVNDVETIIKKRMTDSTRASGIDRIEFVRSTGFEQKGSNEFFNIVKLYFTVITRITL
jgi:hypothetical protein